MKRTFAPLGAFGLMVFAVGSASAASPDYCAVYAKEFAKQAIPTDEGKLSADLIHDRLYHKCLNMDENPPLPTAYTEPRPDGVGRALLGDGGSAASILKDAAAEAPTVDATAIDEAMVKRTAAIEEKPKTTAKRQGRWRGSGYAMWSPQWRSWCAEHFPNSFDPRSGTVIPYESGRREPCL